MSCHNRESEKPSKWLEFIALHLDSWLLKLPPPTSSLHESIKIGFLEDEFSVNISQSVDKCINIAVSRSLKDPKKICDSGFGLRFFISVSGFDEEAQISIMKKNERKANPVANIKIPKSVLAEPDKKVFDVFIVVEMLEFRSLAEEHPEKQKVDNYLAAITNCYSDERLERVCFLLNSPTLQDAFTGRLPFEYLTEVLTILNEILPKYDEVSKYLKSRYNSNVSHYADLNINEVARSIRLANEEGPLSIHTIISKYLWCHKFGLENLKTIVRDYLVSILDTDYNVLSILEAALMVYDKCLLNTAIFSFLNRYADVITSETFRHFKSEKVHIARYIIHAVRVWNSKNRAKIDGFSLPEPTNEL